MSSSLRSSLKRSSSRKRSTPEVLTYDGDTLASPAQRPRTMRTSRTSVGGNTPRMSAQPAKRSGKAPPIHTVVPRPSDEEAFAMVGKCVRIDWPVKDDDLFGEYTAMIFRFNAKNGKHSVFYYTTACSKESTEDVNLYDGSRYWNVDHAPRAPESNCEMLSPPEVKKQLGIDPRYFIGRRVAVEWPIRYQSGTMKNYDAVIVDLMEGSTFRLVYQGDQYLENRDLIKDEQQWRLLDPLTPPVRQNSLISQAQAAISEVKTQPQYLAQPQAQPQPQVMWNPANPSPHAVAGFQQTSGAVVGPPMPMMPLMNGPPMPSAVVNGMPESPPPLSRGPPKAELKAEPKSEPKSEPKAEPKAEPVAEPVAERGPASSRPVSGPH